MAGTHGRASSPGAAFREGHVEADGFRIRYCEAGEGAPLIHLHGAGGLRLTPAHDLLAQHYRVIAFEMPGFGNSPASRAIGGCVSPRLGANRRCAAPQPTTVRCMST